MRRPLLLAKHTLLGAYEKYAARPIRNRLHGVWSGADHHSILETCSSGTKKRSRRAMPSLSSAMSHSALRVDLDRYRLDTTAPS